MKELEDGFVGNVTVTDEATLLRAENEDLRRRIAALTVDRNGAYQKIKELQKTCEDNSRLFKAMSGESFDAKRTFQDMKVRHHAELEKVRKSANDREIVALILGGIIGFVGAGLIIVMYFWIRAGWM